MAYFCLCLMQIVTIICSRYIQIRTHALYMRLVYVINGSD